MLTRVTVNAKLAPRHPHLRLLSQQANQLRPPQMHLQKHQPLAARVASPTITRIAYQRNIPMNLHLALLCGYLAVRGRTALRCGETVLTWTTTPAAETLCALVMPVTVHVFLRWIHQRPLPQGPPHRSPHPSLHLDPPHRSPHLPTALFVTTGSPIG